MQALIDVSTIMVSEDGVTVLVGSADPAYAAVKTYLVDEQGTDFAQVRHLVDDLRVATKSVLAQAVGIVDGGDDEVDPYRLVHGDPVEEVILATAVRLNSEGGDTSALGAFLRRLERNPSPASRSQLFGWLKAGGFVITTEGMIVAYKSVQTSGLSSHGGRENVTVVHQSGEVEIVNGRVPYPVGATVFMSRNLVDDDRQSACSRGLHVGTLHYATNFADRVLVVLVDPKDVVSVPADHGCAKMRVCRLRVAALHDGEQISEAVIQAIRTIPDFDASDEYQARPENAVTPPPIFSILDYPAVDGWDDVIDLDDDQWDDEDDDEEDDDESESDGTAAINAPGLPGFTTDPVADLQKLLDNIRDGH